ncbi:FtsK-like protein [Drosophila-associated adintovirus 2]|uniref:FtsK-like protein n=1 Tax=Drosophila-associated adintovirus 2 TaxID=2744817 RepID=A0A7D4ZIE9_9VIRU|nr:FtsK-like protein [Drosophila-associated adintovirus 2]
MFTQFNHPFTMLICGPSGSGKTTFLENLLKNKNVLINKDIRRIIWCYAEEHAKPRFTGLEYHKGVPDEIENELNEPVLIVLDDLMMGAFNKSVCELFTKGSHHRNLSVIVVTQNIFHKASHTRDISLNTKYIVVFKNPRDKLQFHCLARQIYPENPSELMRIYKEVTEQPHGYLLIDLTQRIHDLLRFRTNIFNTEYSICYCEENGLQKESKTTDGEQTFIICSEKS